MKDIISIFWFRRDLRVEDNHALYQALMADRAVLCIFIFDKNILENLEDKRDKRVTFIYSCLEKLNEKLQEYSSSLLTLYDTPDNAFNRLSEMYSIDTVYANHDYEPYAIRRDESIRSLLEKKNIKFKTFKDQVIFEKDEVVKSDGSPYTVFTPYSKAWKKQLTEIGEQKEFNTKPLLSNVLHLKSTVFSLSDIGFIEEKSAAFPERVIKSNILKNYADTRNIPSIQGTSNLSIHLRFGTVSVRKLVAIALELNEVWLNELIWREFFMMLLFHFPNVELEAFKAKYRNISWRNNEHEFNAWCEGKTGYPLVDAGMHELNETGLMHNRVRMVTASFLVKHLLIDWRWGEAYFAKKLLDYDLSANNGNWQWVAGCGCDAAPYYRIFNPEEQQKKFDPDFIYVKKWIPDFDKQKSEAIVDHKFARERYLTAMKNLNDAI